MAVSVLVGSATNSQLNTTVCGDRKARGSHTFARMRRYKINIENFYGRVSVNSLQKRKYRRYVKEQILRNRMMQKWESIVEVAKKNLAGTAS